MQPSSIAEPKTEAVHLENVKGTVAGFSSPEYLFSWETFPPVPLLGKVRRLRKAFFNGENLHLNFFPELSTSHLLYSPRG